MTILNYSRVRLLTDAYENDGVFSGAIGYVVEVYDNDSYEVEFSKKDGTTIAQIVVKQKDIEVAEVASERRASRR